MSFVFNDTKNYINGNSFHVSMLQHHVPLPLSLNAHRKRHVRVGATTHIDLLDAIFI